MMRDARKRILVVAFAALVLTAAVAFALAPESAAQCAMCRTAVAAGGERVAKTMNAAMLVLLVPPVAIFCSIFAVVARGRKSSAESERDDSRGEF
jgi:di/tricarboxylate transporter